MRLSELWDQNNSTGEYWSTTPGQLAHARAHELSRPELRLAHNTPLPIKGGS